MKTNLDRVINTAEEAKAFLLELISNDEEYHPEDDAHDVIWNALSEDPSFIECDQLNSLMEQIYANTDIDPCGVIIDHSKVVGVYLNGEYSTMTLHELKESGLNVEVARSNGYSHFWSEVVPFSVELIRDDYDPPTIWCTEKKVGFVKGSSQTSNS